MSIVVPQNISDFNIFWNINQFGLRGIEPISLFKTDCVKAICFIFIIHDVNKLHFVWFRLSELKILDLWI